MKNCVFFRNVVIYVIGTTIATYSTADRWNPTTEFSITNGNPNGVWSYASMTTTFSNFTLMPYSSPVIQGRLWGARSTGDLTPSIWIDDNASSFQGALPGQIALHPGPGGNPAVLRWTAPESVNGEIYVVGRFLPGNTGVMKVGVRFNDTWQWQGTDAGAFDLTISAIAGDRVDFVVYYGYAYGATPLEVNISTGPITPGLKLWLKADSLSLADGQDVSVWPDSSENGLDVFQAVEAYQPVFKSSILNDKPVVRFDGTQWLERLNVPGADIIGETAATIFVVENQFSSDPENSTLGWGNKGDNRLLLHTAYQSWVGIQHGNIYAVPEGSGGLAPTGWPDAFHLTEFTRDGGIYSILVDGNEKALFDRTGTPALDISGNAALYIGSDQWSNHLTGDIAEIIVYDWALNAQEKAIVRQYLVDKYGFRNNIWGTDLNNSGRTDLVDFAEFARWWKINDCMAPYWCANSDLDRSGEVNLSDLERFVEWWLTTTK